MILKKYDSLPKEMKNEDVKKFYDILNRKKLSLFFKRLFDIIISLILIILLSPIILIIAIAIKLDSKGKIFYKQERITQYGRKFRIYKFRTMVENADKLGNLITTQGDNRITKIGRVLRKYRLDEIPQLFNIFKGEMSFVGTRPEVKKYVDIYNNQMKATLLMKAGVTSEASIKFKNEDEIVTNYLEKGESIDDIYIYKILPEKMKWNLEYIKYFNFFKDLKIMFNTVLTLIFK